MPVKVSVFWFIIEYLMGREKPSNYGKKHCIKRKTAFFFGYFFFFLTFAHVYYLLRYES